MKVILKKKVDRIGSAGDIISVKDGFARNFLLPQGLAFLATEDNIKRVEKNKKKLEQENMAQKQEVKELAERLNNFSCTIAVEAHEDNLYGSITEADIVKAIEDEQIATIQKDNVVIDTPIKKLGIYEVEIKLHPEISGKIKVWVVKK